MIREAFDAITSNAGLAIGAVGGAALGGFAGASMGAGAQAAALGVGLGAAGLAGGAYAGHYINKQIDKGRAAPMGMRISSSSIKAGEASELTMKPAIEFAEKAADQLEEKAKADPKLKAALPELKAFSSYSKMTLQGTANKEGTAMTIEKVTVTVPGRKEPVTFKVKDVTLPMKDGKIDETNPEAKAALRKIMEQGIDQTIPESARAAAKDALTTLLSKADAPVQQSTPAPGAATASNPLGIQPPSLEKLATTALTMAAKSAVAPGVNPNGTLPVQPGTGPFRS